MSARPTKDHAVVAPASEVRSCAVEGVVVRRSSHIRTANGETTEIFSAPWDVPVHEVRHVIHVRLRPGAVSAWHMHQHQTDQIAVVAGSIRLVLHDRRGGPRTAGVTDVLDLDAAAPTLVVIPPGIWHGVQNLSASEGSAFLNLFDRPYDHDDPDEWRLPIGASEIPYAFER
jgi:dTDP-4-dehydrorhamnose 3,5-epimerase